MDVQNITEQIDKYLPSNYNFQIIKSIQTIINRKSKNVGLQFPEGLLQYSLNISLILSSYANIEIFGDVTYGGCTINDIECKLYNLDLLIHYGHSCLISIPDSVVSCLYIFVEITFDISHLVFMIENNFLKKEISDGYEENEDRSQNIYLCGTIQFYKALHQIEKILNKNNKNIIVPQCHPLSSGETLGCTSCKLDDDNGIVIFIADGRFHLESMMIQNPHLIYYKYDPYTKIMTDEKYDDKSLHIMRKKSIKLAKQSNTIGLIFGSLGRQGSIGILKRIKKLLFNKNYILLVISEINDDILYLCNSIDAFIQISCPRLSIDWNHVKPVLNTYEAFIAFSDLKYSSIYPMDYYSKRGGIWSNYYDNDRNGKQCQPLL